MAHIGRALDQGGSAVQPVFCHLQPCPFRWKHLPIQTCVERSFAMKMSSNKVRARVGEPHIKSINKIA